MEKTLIQIRSENSGVKAVEARVNFVPRVGEYVSFDFISDEREVVKVIHRTGINTIDVFVR